MFSLNDEVVTKTLGVPAKGTVRAAMSPQFYNEKLKEELGDGYQNIEPATQNYYTVEFPEPIKQISLAELEHFFGNKEKAVLAYESLPKYSFLHYPEEELELWQQ